MLGPGLVTSSEWLFKPLMCFGINPAPMALCICGFVVRVELLQDS